MNPAVIQMVAGLAKGIASFNRPKYNASAEDEEALAIARAKAADKQMPGQSQIEDAISLSSANALAASSASGGENIAAIQAADNKSRIDLGIASANHQDMDTANLQQGLRAMGEKRDLEFQMNKFAPYAQNYQEGRQMVGAGLQNMNTQYMLDKLYGKDQMSSGVEEEELKKKLSGAAGKTGGGGTGINTGEGSKFSGSQNMDWDLINTILSLQG